jgi:hypothetical protein
VTASASRSTDEIGKRDGLKREKANLRVTASASRSPDEIGKRDGLKREKADRRENVCPLRIVSVSVLTRFTVRLCKVPRI